MAKAITLDATARERLGKGASRAARRAKQVPAVVYGDHKDPLAIQIPLNVIVALINRGGFMSHTYALTIDGKKTTVLPRDLQLHPVTDVPMHIDFLRLGKGMKVVMAVPVKVVGEDECDGLTKGGVINHTRHDIELLVPGDAIPEYIEVSIAELGLGDAVKISDVSLPEGVVPTITDRDFTICAIVAPSALKSTDNAADEDEGEGEGEASEEATEE